MDPAGLSPFLACRLIALDKNPGVRPIGMCETARRIIAKAILSVTRGDIEDVAGSLNLCAGVFFFGTTFDLEKFHPPLLGLKVNPEVSCCVLWQ